MEPIGSLAATALLCRCILTGFSFHGIGGVCISMRGFLLVCSGIRASLWYSGTGGNVMPAMFLEKGSSLYDENGIGGVCISMRGFLLVCSGIRASLWYSGTGGNVMPAMFLEKGSSLYDEKRNQANLPPAIVKLVPGINGGRSEIIKQNLNAMYQDIVTATTAETFMGGAYRQGTNISSATAVSTPLGGSMENGIHNAVHFWTGDPTRMLYQDMGTFLTASRDPIFYAHHGNIDRLWEKWLYDMPGGRRAFHADSDFLDAEFYIYDETARLVKVILRDALDNNRLGVSYPDVLADELWTNFSPLPFTTGSAVLAARANGVSDVGLALRNGAIGFSSALCTIVKRPDIRKKQKEILIVEGLQVIRNTFLSLIVFVNLPDANSSSPISSAEYVGTFNVIPAPCKLLHTNPIFEIGDNLQRLGIDNEPEIVVTLVVRGTQSITIHGLPIGYT
ncbi:hypothetical protein KP509_10G040900 [Ceratopteris richardii]|uniref:Tyrosinase copper-binding domain-containing protein n=1 Tax=Ceratopteris richardii TaxID=49495 RepID=A0A8T2TY95_CERRI|nr:hypothetical protein KP509_10G040900 [Ceratopteris richardii]